MHCLCEKETKRNEFFYQNEQGLAALGRAPSDDELKKMVGDAGGGDGLTHEQFQKFMANMKEGTATEKEIMDALEVFDKDKNGTIDCKVICLSLTVQCSASFFFISRRIVIYSLL